MTNNELFISTDMKEEHEKLQKKKEKEEEAKPVAVKQKEEKYTECGDCGPIDRYWVFGYVRYRKQMLSHDNTEEGTVLDWKLEREEEIVCTHCDGVLHTRIVGEPRGQKATN